MQISEALLQFIWQYKYFNYQNIKTVDGEDLQLLHVGNLNTNQGPDFLNASIKINDITLVGNIELHINTSNWLQHKHHLDKNYNNVILHVVWKNDVSITNKNNQTIATLELEPLVSTLLLSKYQSLMNNNASLPCSNFLPALSALGWMSFKERLATERLMHKSQFVVETFEKNNNNWEETFWQILAFNFGSTLNKELFFSVAQSIPHQTLAKHKNQIHQIEAMLLGQANLMSEHNTDKYVLMLKKEYEFLKKKYNFNQIHIQPVFAKMRPPNFPSIRLAQLAMLIHHSSHLFSKIKEIKTIAEVEKLLTVTANDFWNYHYTLTDDEKENEPKVLGKQMIQTLIINAIIPVVFAYGNYMNEQEYKDKAIQWLQDVKAENNNITKIWKSLEVSNDNAFDSQALIELYKNYCSKKMCLKCAVGNKVLKG